MKRKVLGLLLSVGMCVTMLAGCGSSSVASETSAVAASTVAAETTAATSTVAAESTAAKTSEYVKYNDIKESLGVIPAINGETTIGFTAKALENEFWRLEKEGAETAGKTLKDLGVNVTVTVAAANGEGDAVGQEGVMKDMINKKYNAIMMSPISDSNLTAAAEQAQEAGIPLICVNDKDGNLDLPIVGADHADSAVLAAEWIAKKIGEKGQVAVVTGLATSESTHLRTDTFVSYLKEHYPNIEVVAQQNADWDRTKAKDVSNTILKQYPDLKAIYANNDTMAMGVLESVKELDLLGKCLVVGTDGTSEAIASIKAGELSATINDFPSFQSQIAVEMVLRKIGGQDVPAKIYSPHALVDSTNCNETAEKLLGWTGFKVK